MSHIAGSLIAGILRILERARTGRVTARQPSAAPSLRQLQRTGKTTPP
ncbi:MAG: hypothetical protein MUE49_07840 [Rhodospirillales bacterium]|nr:hypothetical protein [Rhodospirillales bacterium]